MTPGVFVERLARARAAAILRTDRQELAAPAMDAAIRAGFRIVEFTLTIPGAIELIAEYAKREGIIVGAGTVMTAEEARKAVKAGARYVVSPVVDEAVIRASLDLGVAVLPGTFTPTEMLRAHRAGAQLVKLFPGPADGPAYIRQILGPMPYLRIVPTAGVNEKNAAAHLKAGAWAVGFVSAAFPADEVAARRWDRIEAGCRALLASVAV